MECLVEFDYVAAHTDELTIRKGDIITAVINFEDGWKKGWLKGKEGVFPDNFVRVLKGGNDLIENQSLLEKDTISKTKDQITMHGVKADSNVLNNIKNSRHFLNSPSPLLDKKNFVMNILPSMEKKKWPSNIIPTEQLSQGKSDNSKSEISKSFQSFNKDKINNIDSSKDKKHVIVIFDYKAENPDELQLKEGDIVKVLDKNLIDDGWWKGIKKTGQIGIFPSNFVKPYQENLTSTSIKKIPNNDGILLKTNDNVSLGDQSNISGSISFNDMSIGGRIHVQPGLSKEPIIGKTSNFAFKTKNVYANSCSLDSLDELTKSKRSQETPNKSQNTVVKFRPPNSHYDTSKGDDISNSMEKNFDPTNKIRRHTSSPVHNDGDYYLLKSEFERFKFDVDQKISKLSIRIQTLVEEIDEEKKLRAASEIELVRLRRVVHMLDAQSLNGIF